MRSWGCEKMFIHSSRGSLSSRWFWLGSVVDDRGGKPVRLYDPYRWINKICFSLIFSFLAHSTISGMWPSFALQVIVMQTNQPYMNNLQFPIIFTLDILHNFPHLGVKVMFFCNKYKSLIFKQVAFADLIRR